MIKRLLIANRGEIAVRIARSCQSLHITSIAVYSDADKHSAHSAAADEAIALPGATAAETYLNIDAVLAAAKRADADAIHPGYGFLSENAEFCRRCRQAGIIFIGPDPEAIDLMGSKMAARALVEQLHLPVIPGYHGQDQTPAKLLAEAERIGYPLLIKASAGGGGMGMRVVHSAPEFEAALSAARNEAARAFGDDRVLLERYYPRVRHIEIQLLADRHGNAIHLFERECSLQRRHQKVIEEAPCARLTDTLRQKLGDTALNIANAVNYIGAGTIEYLVVDEGQGLLDHHTPYFFLEMNTRLQVEHAVTEAITGVDLVAWQIRVARGEPLTLRQSDIAIHGHALECRWYAEDPDQGFSPQTGTIRHWQPHSDPALRVDNGIRNGQLISSYYDPLLARLITHAATREEAIQRMAYSLNRSQLLGPVTNQHYLGSVLAHPAFLQGDTHTRFLDQHAGELHNRPGGELAQTILAVAAVGRYRRQAELAEYRTRPAALRSVSTPASVRFQWQGQELPVQLQAAGSAEVYRAALGENILTVEVIAAETVHTGVTRLDVSVDGYRRDFTLAVDEEAVHIHNSACGSLRLPLVSRFTLAAAVDQQGSYRAPMPGRILDVLVEEGHSVVRGAPLLVMESMKMETTTRALADGVVRRIHVAKGDSVEAQTLLIDLETLLEPQMDTDKHR